MPILPESISTSLAIRIQIIMKKIQTVIVEDHSLTRLGMRGAFHSCERIALVGEAASATAGLKLLQTTKPDVAIIDIDLPDMSGTELIQKFRLSVGADDAARTKLLMVTAFTTERVVLDAFAVGADSYFVKTTRFEFLPEVVCLTAEGQLWIDSTIAHVILKYAKQAVLATKSTACRTVTIAALDAEQSTILEADPLTNKELEVLELIVQGYTNNQIAGQLYMSLGTVKVHIRSILSKLCASDRTQAAVLAMRAGLIE
jgi:DNA-binding NarL/FixJ family response regulator